MFKVKAHGNLCLIDREVLLETAKKVRKDWLIWGFWASLNTAFAYIMAVQPIDSNLDAVLHLFLIGFFSVQACKHYNRTASMGLIYRHLREMARQIA